MNRYKYAKAIDRRRAAWDKKMAKRLRGYFRRERKAVLEALANGVDYAIAVNNVSAELERILAYYYVKVFNDFARDRYQNNADAKDIATILAEYEAAVAPLMAIIADKVVGINAYTIKRINQAITKARGAGGTVGEVQQAIMDEVGLTFKSMTQSRALTIARTEVGTVASFGQEESFRQSGFEKKEWNALNDNLTRDSHLELDGEIVGINDKFSNGLKRPLDPNGTASQIINCRCVLMPVVE